MYINDKVAVRLDERVIVELKHSHIWDSCIGALLSCHNLSEVFGYLKAKNFQVVNTVSTIIMSEGNFEIVYSKTEREFKIYNIDRDTVIEVGQVVLIESFVEFKEIAMAMTLI